MDAKLVVGGEKSGLRLWKVGAWDDSEEIITVGKGASADIVAEIPDGVGKDRMLAVGMDDGVVRFVNMSGKRAKVVGEVRHDEVEGVLGLGFEVGKRMCSGGGGIVKVWEESLGKSDDGEDEEVAVNGKRGHESESEEDDAEAAENGDSDADDTPKKKRKRKRKKGKAVDGGQHVMAFTGMD